MQSSSVSSAYLAQAADLAGNPGQLAAYESQGHCVVLAGPGSGKTKTLVLKLARILAEDVRAPRGAACITYSQECARELTRRLEGLGLREAPNLFIGTVHGFCLRHLLMPYGRLAKLPIPFPLAVATQRVSDRLLRQSGDALFGPNHPYKAIDLGRHRRSVLDRNSVVWRSEEELAAWAIAYEAALRNEGLIDYDDMVVFGQRLIVEHDWVLPLVQAKFPVLAVDEYQDLGVALHRIVKRLAFDGGVRLFAVGDADQSIYGFTGADGGLLTELAARDDIERVQLQLNYRSGTRIVNASELALGEARGYRAYDPARQASIAFVLRPGGLADQAAHAIAQIIPTALAAKPGRTLGDIAILYKDYRAGDVVAEAATAGGIDYIRVDNAAPYRKVSLTSWVEDCAAWCAGGWRIGRPQLRGLIERYLAFHRAHLDESQARREGQVLTALLWSLRQDVQPAREFVAALRTGILDDLLAAESALADQKEQLDRMTAALAEGGALASLDIVSLGGRDGSPAHLNLLTLHSAKGCEYDVVIMVGLDLGNLPWRNESPEKLRESRRLFYVGLTRARDEVHMLYSGFVDGRFGPMRLGRSPFLDELENRMRTAGLQQ
ncbi:ATP-dependent helicase [Pseudomonas aeruginosa]|jgi:DNA helicase-2/ATP-dependent DNA helicase PcrA|uniref:ATP-dependent helicase n=1 Tax=Pseudomonas aeruginosa TaxID=287 RepID=UPI000BA063B5|nr:ATP-dependent helicase [Pseudomonas aeruginosa]EIU1321663.1 ATP-dependent helicase [Pseudomonas aeruginosa]ELY3880559.1 ATP-dependent helicase [Pseudomonas aeruginosa]MCO2105924.1 ATP-dependent helicase [Pseudomonas aeruginosa]MDV8060254.1 ATP-dependent helicase [Pseudomonas aeruginosa]MDV8088031.1 ATP-dependent helicase [Pseudomonas aeruginosa]